MKSQRKKKQQAGTRRADLALTRPVENKIPTIRSSRSGVVVKHREYLFDVLSDANSFAVKHWININPGLFSSFPWLSAIANRYEYYTFHKLDFVFESSQPATGQGVVYTAVDYDAADEAPDSKVHLMSYQNARKNVCWASGVVMSCNPADLKRGMVQKVVRDRALAPNLDIKTYDTGKLWIATGGSQLSEQSLGEIYADYVVEFFTPQMVSDAEVPDSLKVTSGGVVSKTAPFGTVPVVAGGMADVLVGAANELLFRDPGEYLVDLVYSGTGLNNTPPTITPVGNLSSKGVSVPLANAPATDGTFAFQVHSLEPNAGFTLDMSPSATTIGGLIARVARYSYAL